MPNFSEPLTTDELTVFLAFKSTDSITFPLGGMSVTQTLNVLHSLKQKQLITGKGPYHLTKKGKRLRSQLNKVEQPEQS